MQLPILQTTRSRRFWFWSCFAVVLTGCVAALTLQRYLDAERQQHLADIVKATGGEITLPPTPIERAKLWHYEIPINETEVVLDGGNFNDEWLEKNSYLSELNVRTLVIRATEISDTALARLIDGHMLEQFEIEGQKVGAAAAQSLGKQSRLFYVGIRKDVGIDEKNFALLPLEQLARLYVEDSKVPVPALQQLKRCRALVDVSFDGTQWDDATSQIIQSLGTVKAMTLQGMNTTIGDEHFDRLERVESLEHVMAISTEATPERIAEFKKSRPNCHLLLLE